MEVPNSTISIKEDVKDDIFIFRLKGRLDTDSTLFVEKKICEMVNKGHGKIVIDLENVTYLSSSGMRMFLSITKMLRSLSGKLIITRVPTQILDLLKMSGFDHALELCSTDDEAFKKI